MCSRWRTTMPMQILSKHLLSDLGNRSPLPTWWLSMLQFLIRIVTVNQNALQHTQLIWSMTYGRARPMFATVLSVRVNGLSNWIRSVTSEDGMMTVTNIERIRPLIVMMLVVWLRFSKTKWTGSGTVRAELRVCHSSKPSDQVKMLIALLTNVQQALKHVKSPGLKRNKVLSMCSVFLTQIMCRISARSQVLHYL